MRTVLNEIIFGSDFVNLIGNNQFYNNIENEYTITLFCKKYIHFKYETELKYKYPYYYLKYNNITIRFFESNADINDIILYLDNAIYIKTEDKIYCNAKFYQNLENPIFNSQIQIKDYKVVKTFTLKLKNILISDSNIPKCYQCKKYYNSHVHIEDYEFLCIPCADENYVNKNLKVNLQNQSYLITGGRVIY